MTNEIIVRRLSMIKYLYKLGIQQALLTEAISYTSVLTLHDCIDMFMNLAAEKRGLSKGQYLMQYFDSIAELTLKSSVDKINKRRRALKHDAIVPGRVEIQDTCSITKIFLEENTKILFGRDFNDILLFDLISYDVVREFLKNGNALLEKNEFKNAAKEIAKAYFHLLLIEESLSKRKDNNPWYNSSTQPLIKEGKFYTKAFETVLEGQDELFKEPKIEDGYVEVSEGVAALAYSFNKSFSYIFESLRILYLGLDYRKYNHYMSFMPQVIRLDTRNGKYDIGVPMYTPNDPWTKETITFAIEFVMEFALKLQEFAY